MGACRASQRPRLRAASAHAGSLELTTTPEQTKVRLPGGVTEHTTWNDDGRPEVVAYEYGGSSALASMVITQDCDPLGRLIGRETARAGVPELTRTETEGYSYNAAGWLVEEVVDGEAWAQSFDRAGNRLSRSNGAEGFTATYGPDNRLATITRDGRPKHTFRYDVLGPCSARSRSGRTSMPQAACC